MEYRKRNSSKQKPKSEFRDAAWIAATSESGNIITGIPERLIEQFLNND
jgi:hypothetical protein